MKRIVILCFAFCLLLAGCNCEHSFAAGEEGCVCSECGETVPHTYSEAGNHCICTVCSYETEHDYNRADSMFTCGQCGFSLNAITDIIPAMKQLLEIDEQSDFKISFDEEDGVIVGEFEVELSKEKWESAVNYGMAETVYDLNALLYQMIEEDGVDFFQEEFGLQLDHRVTTSNSGGTELLRVDERGCVVDGKTVKSWDELS